MHQDEAVTIQAISFPESWERPETPGFGTYPGPQGFRVPPGRYVEAVGVALKAGFRHLDTAHTYRNEEEVGAAVAASSIPRHELFLTSKLHPRLNSRWRAARGLRGTLSRLGIDTLDMFLVHYPGIGNPIGAWKALLGMREKALCRHVGVSNFEIEHLRVLQRRTGHLPEVNQIEFHPLLFGCELRDLVAFCHDNGVQVEAYSPLAWGGRYGLLREVAVRRAAERHGSSPARIVLQWCLQHGVRPIVGSLSSHHIRENAGPYDLTLSAAEMAELDALGADQVRLALREWGWDPPRVRL